MGFCRETTSFDLSASGEKRCHLFIFMSFISTAEAFGQPSRLTYCFRNVTLEVFFTKQLT